MMKTALFLLAILAAVARASAASAGAAPLPVAACVGCHAASGGDPALPRLSGRKADDIVAEVKAFRDGSMPGTVMDRIAKGFTDGEIAVIAAWYAAQQ